MAHGLLSLVDCLRQARDRPDPIQILLFKNRRQTETGVLIDLNDPWTSALLGGVTGWGVLRLSESPM
jgi:hypothetical protein